MLGAFTLHQTDGRKEIIPKLLAMSYLGGSLDKRQKDEQDQHVTLWVSQNATS